MNGTQLLEWFEQNFKWDSDEQHKGFLNLIQYLKLHCPNGFDPQLLIASYFIQKDHESNDWWRSLLGDQLGQVYEQIKKLQEQLWELQKQIQKPDKVK